uniref:Transposable element Tc3 transposase-like DNA-binding HTH domain-containing protein n=1 Tax=Caenorhabditis japonica TaxID=281687 RepID=A0A8R1ID50_CAEJA
MGPAPLHTVAEQEFRDALTGIFSSYDFSPRKVTSRDERNIIRVVSNSPKSLNDVCAELNLSVCKQTVHNAITRSGSFSHNEKSYEEKIPVGASRNSVLAQQQCGVELGP